MLRSARQAIGYAYAHRRGPKLRSPKYGERIQNSHKGDDLVGSQVREAIYGPKGKGFAGIVPGSMQDDWLEAWATSKRADAFAQLPHRLRLEAAGLCRRVERLVLEHLRKAGVVRGPVRTARAKRHEYSPDAHDRPLPRLVFWRAASDRP